MTASRDPDQLIHAFLHEGLDELPDPAYDAVRDRIEQTRQRAFIGPWRTSDMNRFLKYGLAAAAVVVIAIVAYQFLGNSNTGGPGATETPQVTASPTQEPSASEAAGLPVGSTFALFEAPLGITVTIPAPGWFSPGGSGGSLEKGVNGADPPDGAGIIVFEGDLGVYQDPCRWKGAAQVRSTVDELVFLLASQPVRDPSGPVDVTVGGYAGKSITLHVPDDAAFSAGKFTDCDEGYFATFGSDADPGPARYAQGPGQIDELWILDVDGVTVVIDIAYYAGTPAEDVAELRAFVESATFELP